jgi:hypothetical protein
MLFYSPTTGFPGDFGDLFDNLYSLIDIIN